MGACPCPALSLAPSLRPSLPPVPALCSCGPVSRTDMHEFASEEASAGAKANPRTPMPPPPTHSSLHRPRPREEATSAAAHARAPSDARGSGRSLQRSGSRSRSYEVAGLDSVDWNQLSVFPGKFKPDSKLCREPLRRRCVESG